MARTTIAFTCRRCGQREDFVPEHVTLSLIGGELALLAKCAATGETTWAAVPPRILRPLLRQPVLVDPDVRDLLATRGAVR